MTESSKNAGRPSLRHSEAQGFAVSLPEDGNVEIRLFDSSGRLYSVVHKGYLEKGTTRIPAHGMPRTMLFYQIVSHDRKVHSGILCSFR